MSDLFTGLMVMRGIANAIHSSSTQAGMRRQVRYTNEEYAQANTYMRKLSLDTDTVDPGNLSLNVYTEPTIMRRLGLTLQPITFDHDVYSLSSGSGGVSGLSTMVSSSSSLITISGLSFATKAAGFLFGEKLNRTHPTLISGGDNIERCAALLVFLESAKVQGLPVIILHRDNHGLESLLARSSEVQIVSQTDLFYNPIRSMTSENAAQVLYDAAPESLKLTLAVLELLKIAAECQITRTIHSLTEQNIVNMQSVLDDLHIRGAMSEDDYNTLSSRYRAYSADAGNAQSYLNALAFRIQSVFGSPNENRDEGNFNKAINQKGIILINLGSSTANDEYVIKLVVSHLSQILSPYALVLDGMPIGRYDCLRQLIRSVETFALSDSNLPSALTGNAADGDIFLEMVGLAERTVIFNHSAGMSRTKWVDNIGKYKKMKFKPRTGISVGFGRTDRSEGYDVEETEEYCVAPDILGKLSKMQCCIYDGQHKLIGMLAYTIA